MATRIAPIWIRLEELRNAKGWSQAELARRSGVPQPTISRIEARESRSVNLDNLERLADALGVNAAVMIAHEREPEPRKGGRGR
jgi:transcriptional regulator with XRE-family HTH domain